MEARVLWPPATREGSSNDLSAVLRVDWPQHCAVLAGDVPKSVERELAPGLERCEILKLAHYGSDTSSTAVWLDALDPEIALASCGRRFGARLPSPRFEAACRSARSVCSARAKTARFRSI